MSLRALARRAVRQPVRLPQWERAGVEVSLWRLDQLDAVGSGNKLFKLDENLRVAEAAGYSRVLSFGGAFSNHIHALARLGAARGFATIGVIRGEPAAADNPTLRDAHAAGMRLHFVDRATYRAAHGAAPERERWFAQLRREFGDCHIVPEGGANREGALGCRPLGEVIGEQPLLPDVVVLACGTGATLAGVVAGLQDRAPVIGVAVLRGGGFLDDDVQRYLQQLDADGCRRWRIDTEAHEGGYARVSEPLRCFVDDLQRRGIPVEPVYTGKMLYAIDGRIRRGEFARGTRVLAIHTGGLQGMRGLAYRQNQQQAAMSAG